MEIKKKNQVNDILVLSRSGEKYTAISNIIL